MRFINPDTIAAPASNYSQGVVVPANAERLIIAGQIGANPDGSLAEGLEAQMERAWLNMFAILEDAGMTKQNLVKITVFMVGDGHTAAYREVRDRMLDGHAPAATYLVVAGLASPEMLFEVEGEAVAS